jgi:hypothetical protein
MEKKRKSGERDWDAPENRIKKQNAFRLYAAGRDLPDVMRALETKHKPTLEKMIYSEKWDDYAKIWQENPETENLYPWDKERPVALVAPPARMEEMDKKRRLECIKGFSMYCSGRTLRDIAEELKVSESTVCLWRDTQRWIQCRERLVNEQSPAPWEDDGVPSVMSEITASLETMKKSIKFLTGRVLVKAADAAQDLDGMEALGMMRNIKQLAEAAAINFSEGNNQQNAIQINIATKLESMKIPENNTYEAELVVNE